MNYPTINYLHVAKSSHFLRRGKITRILRKSKVSLSCPQELVSVLYS